MIPRWLIASFLIVLVLGLITYFVASRIVILLTPLPYLAKDIITVIIVLVYDVFCITYLPELVTMCIDPLVDEDRVRSFVARLATALSIVILIFSLALA